MDFSRLAAALEGNAALQRRARLAALSFAVLGAAQPVTVRVGERIAIEKGAAADAAFSLTASPATWAEFAKPVPAVGFQSLVGMQRVGHLRVEGDILAWGRHMLFVEQLLAALRPSGPTEKPAPIGAPVIEPVVGRYLRLDLNGRPHRLYFEEAGHGIPLLCLHTAGADGRHRVSEQGRRLFHPVQGRG